MINIYKYIVTYRIFQEELQGIITIDEAIEDNDILEEIISDKLIEYLPSYYGERNICITSIEPIERNYTTKELNNCTYDNIFK